MKSLLISTPCVPCHLFIACISPLDCRHQLQLFFFYHHRDLVSSHDTFNLAWPAAPRVVVSFLQRSTIPYGVKAIRRYIRELGGAPNTQVCVPPALCEIVASLCGIPSSSRVNDITPCCREALAE